MLDDFSVALLNRLKGTTMNDGKLPPPFVVGQKSLIEQGEVHRSGLG